VTSDEQKLYAALAGIAAAVLALIWLTGGLAGLLFGSGWAPIPLGELLVTALRLPSHLGDPRAAWPRGTQAALPNAAGFYVTAVLILAALSAFVLLAQRALDPLELPRLGARKRRPPSARWASGRDLAPLRVPAPQPGRLTLGRSGRSLLAAGERQ